MPDQILQIGESRFPNPASRIPTQYRVLMLAPTPYFADRGCHVRIYEEARTLINLGHEVRIVTYHIGRDMPGIPTVRIPRIPWYKKLAAGPSWHKPYLDILLFFKALSEARAFRPDIIHAHLHEGALIGMFLKRVLGIPLIFDCQGSLTAEIIDHGFIRKGGLLHRLFGALEDLINRRADFIIASSTPGARDLLENRGVAAEKVRGLIDGVDTEIFRPYPRDEARRALGLSLDRPVVVFLGILNRYQGVDLLLESAKLLKERGTAPHFLVMGFPEEKYRQKAEEMGITDCLTFTGRIDYAKAPLCLCVGDVALSPKISATEANGKLFNYMACGLPTLVFDTPVNREILGDAGVYAHFGDAADFADKLESLLQNEPLRAELATKSREKAVREHSWLVRGELLAQIYSKIVKPREAGTGNRQALCRIPNPESRIPAVQVPGPRISIIMPCFQQRPFLEEAVRSVIDQQGVDVELIVMDPGSTDGSRELLLALSEEYGERLVLCFEPDRGQSDAVNKGMARAKGRVLGWLNSDDRLRPGTLAAVAPILASDDPRWLYGRAGMIDGTGRSISSLITRYKNLRSAQFSRLKLLTENFIPQMAVFWNRAMWNRAGGLRTEKHLDMDYDLWLRFAAVTEPKVLTDELADFRVHAAAKGSRQTGPQLDAAYRTAREHAAGLGWRGSLALVIHRLLSLRTRLLYWWLKP